MVKKSVLVCSCVSSLGCTYWQEWNKTIELNMLRVHIGSLPCSVKQSKAACCFFLMIKCLLILQNTGTMDKQKDMKNSQKPTMQR